MSCSWNEIVIILVMEHMLKERSAASHNRFCERAVNEKKVNSIFF